MSTEDNVDKKATKKPTKAIKGFTDEERGAMRERVQELKADKADGESAVLAKIGEMQPPNSALGERLHAIIKANAPSLRAEALVRDARVCQERQGRLLLPTRAQVQDEVRDVRLQRQREPRRRLPVVGRLRAEGVDCRRRGKDRRAREESGELRARHGVHSIWQARNLVAWHCRVLFALGT